jgi:hypothetical protein
MDNGHAHGAHAFDPIRSDISRRVDALDRDYRHLSIGEIVRQADALRHLGSAHGLESVCRLAGALNDAVSRDGRAAIIQAYIESLREAAWSDAGDVRTCELLLAAVSVRLAN